MYEYGTSNEQLAWVKVAASEHAQYNKQALLQKPVTVEDVLNSPMLSDPLHRLDSCVVTDGGGAVIIAGSTPIRIQCKARLAILYSFFASMRISFRDAASRSSSACPAGKLLALKI